MYWYRATPQKPNRNGKKVPITGTVVAANVDELQKKLEKLGFTNIKITNLDDVNEESIIMEFDE